MNGQDLKRELGKLFSSFLKNNSYFIRIVIFKREFSLIDRILKKEAGFIEITNHINSYNFTCSKIMKK